MHLDTKSEILECIAPTEIQTRVKPDTTAAILEGAVIVRQVRPRSSPTMSDNADTISILMY